MTTTTTPTRITGHETTVPRMHPTTPQELPFAPGSVIRAFLLERDEGNLLVYSTGRLAEDAAELERRGGVTRQYLNHWHESIFGLAPESLGARLLHHAADAPQVARRGGRGLSFSRRHHLDGDFEAIPIPGHTPGATAYLWEVEGLRVLFSGDTVLLDGDEWVAAVLDSSDRDRYLESLELLRETEFDVLVPWAASAEGPYLALVDEAERRERLDAIIDRVRAGADR